MQEANPTKTFPLVVYEAGYDRMAEQVLPLVLDLRMNVVSACKQNLMAIAMVPQ